MDRVYLTREGYEKLVGDLENLKNVKRKEIAQALAHARSLGDLSENAEYDAAKEALTANEKRIQEIQDKLSRAEIIDDSQISTDKVYIGAKVKLLDLDSDEEIEYTLVGQDEADALSGLISVTSPVGKALLGRGENDTVEITVPAGVLKYRVVKISR